MGPVHLYGTAHRTTCMHGTVAYGGKTVPVTKVIGEVTCGSCKRSRAYKDALLREREVKRRFPEI